MQRRKFLKSTAALSAGALAYNAPMILGAQDKTDSKPLIVGTGEYKYQVIHDWAKLPSQYSWPPSSRISIPCPPP